jgi:hypothetical protein
VSGSMRTGARSRRRVSVTGAAPQPPVAEGPVGAPDAGAGDWLADQQPVPQEPTHQAPVPQTGLTTTAKDLDPLATTGLKSLRSSFGTIRDTLGRYEKATTAQKRGELLQRLNELCIDWLNEHRGSKDPKDVERRAVVDRLVDEVAPELARLSQDQAEDIYLADAAGTGQHNLQSITQVSRGFAGHVGNDGMNAYTKKDKAAAAGLTGAQLSAIRTFTNQDYKYINPATANSASWMKYQADNATGIEKDMFEADEKTRFEEGSLHAGIAMRGLRNMPVYAQPVFRGASMTDDELEKLKKDGGWSSTAMASLTKERSIATSFASTSAKTPDKKHHVLFQIDDHGARDIEQFSQFSHEKEVLLPAGSAFRIESMKQTDPPNGYADAAKARGAQWWLVVLKPKGSKPERPSTPAPGRWQSASPRKA